MPPKQKRIVITGCAGVDPVGNDLPGFVDATENSLIDRVLAGELGLEPIGFPNDKLDIHVWGLVKGVDKELVKQAAGRQGRRCLKYLNRTGQCALVSAVAACREAGILRADGTLTIANPSRGGICTACDVEEFKFAALRGATRSSLMGALGNRKALKQTLWAIFSHWLGSRKAKERIDDLFERFVTEQDYINTLLNSDLGEITAMMRGVSINSISGIGMTTGLTGPMLNITTACEAGIAAMSVAQNMILLDEADVVLTGGMWTRLNPISLFGLLAWRSIISPGTTPDCCRPFDASRNGMIPSEGGAMFVFEDEEHAVRRGAKILAEVAGLGAATAPQCTVEPHKGTFTTAMRQALANARIEPRDLGFISAHATGTVEGDAVEAQSLSEVLGDAAKSIPVTGLKAGGGHQVLGSSAKEILVLIRTAIERGLAPPNPTLREPDPKLPSLFLPVEATPLDPDKQHFAAQSAGFVGMHRVAILRRPRN